MYPRALSWGPSLSSFIYFPSGTFPVNTTSISQLYVSTKPSSSLPPFSLTNCLKKIKSWLSSNHQTVIKLNFFLLALNQFYPNLIAFPSSLTAPRCPLPSVIESGSHPQQYVIIPVPHKTTSPDLHISTNVTKRLCPPSHLFNFLLHFLFSHSLLQSCRF